MVIGEWRAPVGEKSARALLSSAAKAYSAFSCSTEFTLDWSPSDKAVDATFLEKAAFSLLRILRTLHGSRAAKCYSSAWAPVADTAMARPFGFNGLRILPLEANKQYCSNRWATFLGENPRLPSSYF